jgi:hypothetical protein
VLDDEPEVHKPNSGGSKATPASARNNTNSSSSSKAAQPRSGSAADSPARLPGGVPPALPLTEGQLNAVRAQLEALLPADRSFEEAQGSSGAAPAAGSSDEAPEEPQRKYIASCMDTYEEYDEDGEVIVPEGYEYVDHEYRRPLGLQDLEQEGHEPHVLPPFLQAIMDEEEEDEREEERHAQALWASRLHQRQQQPQQGDNPFWGKITHIPTLVVENEDGSVSEVVGDQSSSSEAPSDDVPPRAASPEP